jgi:hydroxypyruvate isomerase
MNYRWLLRQIDASGYQGWVGCEYRPRRGTVEGLGWAKACGVKLG